MCVCPRPPADVLEGDVDDLDPSEWQARLLPAHHRRLHTARVRPRLPKALRGRVYLVPPETFLAENPSRVASGLAGAVAVHTYSYQRDALRLAAAVSSLSVRRDNDGPALAGELPQIPTVAPAAPRPLLLRCCCAAAALLLRCCCAAAALLLRCCCAAAALLLRCCCAAAALLLLAAGRRSRLRYLNCGTCATAARPLPNCVCHVPVPQPHVH